MSQQSLDENSQIRKITIFCQKNRQIEGRSALLSQNVNKFSLMFRAFVILRAIQNLLGHPVRWSLLKKLLRLPPKLTLQKKIVENHWTVFWFISFYSFSTTSKNLPTLPTTILKNLRLLRNLDAQEKFLPKVW